MQSSSLRVMEVWLHAFAQPGRTAELAQQAERWGFDGLLVADSQNLTADVWVELALAGAATASLCMGPGVTNPITRHLAVTASAAATLQVETGGRATLGFAQGDSALTQIGRRRLRVDEFERALQTLQKLLGGEPVQLNGAESSLQWLRDVGVPKVPVHVAATGPRTIEAAARHAEGVDLTVGADLERVRWGVGVAREAAPADLVIGAYVNVAVDPDRDRARELVRGSVATLARFSAEAAAPSSEAGDRDSAVLAKGYSKDEHGQAAAGFAQGLQDQFIDRFAVCGPADEALERLRTLSQAGLDRVIVVPGSLDTGYDAVWKSIDRLAALVGGHKL